MTNTNDTGGVAKQLKLWFFRDLSDEQRLALFRITMHEVPPDQLRTHTAQSAALGHVLSAIEPPKPEVAGLDERGIEAFVKYGDLRSYDHVDLMERVLGERLRSVEEVRDSYGILQGWNITIAQRTEALLQPDSKEGRG